MTWKAFSKCEDVPMLLQQVQRGATLQVRYENPLDIWYTYIDITYDGTHYRCSSLSGCYDVNTLVSDAGDFHDRPFSEEELGHMLTELAHSSSVVMQYTFCTPGGSSR
jgi:hypothetical protein